MTKASKPKVEKVVTYRAISPDGLLVANASTEKDALALLKVMMQNQEALAGVSK